MSHDEQIRIVVLLWLRSQLYHLIGNLRIKYLRIQMLIWIKEATPYADPDPDQTFESQKAEFLHEKILKVGKRSINIPTKVQKPFFKGRKPGLFVNFGQFPCSWIRIRIPNTDPDPRQPNDCGSRWIRIRIWIHNTELNSM
jgi:hypothetical protein